MYCGDVCKYWGLPEVSVLTGSQSRQLTGSDCIPLLIRDRGRSRVNGALSESSSDKRWAVADATVATRLKNNDPTREQRRDDKRDRPVPSTAFIRWNPTASRWKSVDKSATEENNEKSCESAKAGFFAQCLLILSRSVLA